MVAPVRDGRADGASSVDAPADVAERSGRVMRWREDSGEALICDEG